MVYINSYHLEVQIKWCNASAPCHVDNETVEKPASERLLENGQMQGFRN